NGKEVKKTNSTKNCNNGFWKSSSSCKCNKDFRPIDDWTKRYTDTSELCIPYCFPFCTNKMFSTTDNCECSYSHFTDDDDDSIASFVPNSFKALKKLFKEYNNLNLATGANLALLSGFEHQQAISNAGNIWSPAYYGNPWYLSHLYYPKYHHYAIPVPKYADMSSSSEYSKSKPQSGTYKGRWHSYSAGWDSNDGHWSASKSGVISDTGSKEN
ncbi:hypothetical protein L9F63_019635, partial [Diploptera punctata]